MHIADGYLPGVTLWLGGGVSLVLLGATLRSIGESQAPRTAVMTSALFVGSLLSIPLGGTSVHLTLVGLAGIILGPAAFPAVCVSVALQTLLLGHGGLTTLGVNAASMGIGSLAAGAVFALRGKGIRPRRDGSWAIIAAVVGTTVALCVYAAALLSAGKAFEVVAWMAFALHLPVVALEGAVAGSAVAYVARVRPGLLGRRASPAGESP